MAKLGMEYCDDLTPTSESGSSDSSASTTATGTGSIEFDEDEDNSESSSYDSSTCSQTDNHRHREKFPILLLPVEIRAKILNMIHQRQVPSLRLVSKQWREEVDQFYEFSFSIYDTSSNLPLINNLRCRECVIWKLTKELKTPLFHHPSYLKVIKVFGPISAENLKNLISSSVNLEHLAMTRRANYPWVLNLQDTPALSNLTELRYLRLYSEEHLQIHRPSSINANAPLPKVPPMMDCYFPKLKAFEILKRFPVWNYSHYVTSVLKFVSKHAKTLTHIELDFIPLSCIVWLGDRDVSSEEISSSDEEAYHLGLASGRRGANANRNEKYVSPTEINLPQLCKIRLQKMWVTTMGYSKDIHIWKSLLESQAYPARESLGDEHLTSQNFQYHQPGLKELRFDWLCRDQMTETRARVSGFPWVHFQTPIEACFQTLVHVELANLSMVTKAFPSSPIVASSDGTLPGVAGAGAALYKVVPFDLSIFRHCTRLKSLVLRCRENHARIHPVDLGPFKGAAGGNGGNGAGEDEDAANGNGNVNCGGPSGSAAPHRDPPHPPPGENQNRGGVVATVGEILLMVNAMDLPETLEQLEIFRFPMLTTDIEACVRKLINLKKLYFHDCGKTHSFGVSADIIKLMTRLRHLKFLEIVGFNDATEERKRALELVFQQIGRPFEGQDTWLELSDGSTTAHETLKAVSVNPTDYLSI